MRTVNGCILLLAAISITFAAVSGAYHLDMQQLLALILRQENVPVQEQIVFWQIRVPRILAALFLGAALAGDTIYQFAPIRTSPQNPLNIKPSVDSQFVMVRVRSLTVALHDG